MEVSLKPLFANKLAADFKISAFLDIIHHEIILTDQSVSIMQYCFIDVKKKYKS